LERTGGYDREESVETNGYFGIADCPCLTAAAVINFITGIRDSESLRIILAIVLFIIGIILWSGILIVQPNQAKVLTFFGSYLGSIRTPGIWMTVPFVNSKKVSLKVRNFNSEKLKVNDVTAILSKSQLW
jgi:hypothetical protein